VVFEKYGTDNERRFTLRQWCHTLRTSNYYWGVLSNDRHKLT
jgi:hypothetical protein